MKLIHCAGIHNMQEVQVGDKALTFRNEECVVTGWFAPHKPSSTGRVYVEFADGCSRGFYPSVVDMKWIDA